MKLIVFSEIKWEYLRTRKQQILKKFPKETEILFIESFVLGKKNHYRPCKDGNVTFATIPFLKHFPYPWLNFLFSFSISRLLLQLLAVFWLGTLRRRTGFSAKDCSFFVSNVYWTPIIKGLKRKFLLYDCNDDPMGFPDSPRWLQNRFAELCRIADVVVTVSDGLGVLVEKYRQKNDVRIVGNGVEFEHFDTRQDTPPELQSMDTGLLGYAGAVSDWFDVDLLLKIADGFPEASIVIVGPIISRKFSSQEEALQSKPNIHLLGAKPYQQLPAYVQSFDVCLIPFLINDLTTILNPNKLYEYLAAGKAIVSMDYSKHISDLSQHIYIADNHDEFLEKIHEALNASPKPREWKSIAQANSWKSKADEIYSLFPND